MRRRRTLKRGLLLAIVAIFMVSKLHAVSVMNEANEAVIDEIVHEHLGQAEPESEGNFYVNIGVVFFCTCFAGLMSGLTIGLASIDRLSLEVDAIGNPDVKRMTERIFPVID